MFDACVIGTEPDPFGPVHFVGVLDQFRSLAKGHPLGHDVPDSLHRLTRVLMGLQGFVGLLVGRPGRFIVFLGLRKHVGEDRQRRQELVLGLLAELWAGVNDRCG